MSLTGLSEDLDKLSQGGDLDLTRPMVTPDSFLKHHMRTSTPSRATPLQLRLVVQLHQFFIVRCIDRETAPIFGVGSTRRRRVALIKR